MKIVRVLVLRISVAVAVCCAGVVVGQDFPNKPIRILASAAGGGTDFTARLIGQGISVPLGQPVIVDNRPPTIAAEFVARAAPDGSTLFVAAAPFWVEPLLRKTSYDPVKDFLPISLLTDSVNLLLVHPSLPVKSVRELIALAKAKPGALNFAAASVGSSSHLAGEVFKFLAGVNIVPVHYKSGAQALTSLLSGETQLTFAPLVPAWPHVKSGRLRALAVTSARPSPLAPGLPTMADSGLPGYKAGSAYGMFTAAKTPQVIIDRLNREIVLVLSQPAVKQKFFDTGADVIGSSPQELAAAMRSEMDTLGRMIRETGIRVE